MLGGQRKIKYEQPPLGLQTPVDLRDPLAPRHFRQVKDHEATVRIQPSLYWALRASPNSGFRVTTTTIAIVAQIRLLTIRKSTRLTTA